MDDRVKVAEAIMRVGEGCQSGAVYVDPYVAADAVLSALRSSGTGRSEAEVSEPGIVLRELSLEEAQARYQALIDARWRERVAEAYALPAQTTGGAK